MSPEKQTSPVVIEGGRIWPFYEATGIPVTPRKTKCIGPERCPAIAKRGRCFPTSVHHLLFESKRVRSFGYPHDLLIENDFLKVIMSECRHNVKADGDSQLAIHQNYDRSHIPDRDIAYRFIDESRLLRAVTSSVSEMYDQVFTGLRGFRAFNKSEQERKLHVVSGRFVDATVRFEYIRAQLDTIEVIPERTVQKELQDAYTKRAGIREVFTGNSLERVPQPLLDAAVEVRLLDAA